ncbi:cysteine-rich receptor-like protein kinase 44 [Phragmites australis]|uniref:cysteine-rich receptor-like protein kinase 44 n=1 Tax=Phragmites australis TaxID=29695 RepID=UPI002D778ECE|nr:cysteine-rich receptor-like protein kinase 44 [Phragmites australis]
MCRGEGKVNRRSSQPLAMLAGRYALIVVALALLPPPTLAAGTLEDSCDDSTYAKNSTFQANLNLLAATLPANASASPAGFATASIGAAPDQVNGLALCRGDTNASSCAVCVAAAFRDAQLACDSKKGATVYQDACTLRFAGIRFLDFLREDQWLVSELVPMIDTASGSVNTTDAWFSAAVKGILTAVVDRAAAAAGTNSTRNYFATGEMDFDPKIYGLAQCAPDLNPSQCRGCLGYLLLVTTTQFLSGRPPWNSAFVVWCSLRYSVSPVYDGRAMLQVPAPPAPPQAATPESGAGRKRSAAGIFAGIASLVVLMVILSVFFFLRFRRRIKATENDHPLKKIGRAQCTIFDLPTLQEATEHFSEKNKLGAGGFGTVYKGILSDGQEIAVKKLLGTTGHGLHQLHNEVLVLAELQHKNLVRLEGFCSHQNDTLLVYEYIKNGSLDNFLFDDRGGNALNWEQQYNIILGIAKGILYLQEDSSLRIIHRDLKASNILLDDDMEPKIADFGLARLLGEGHTHSQTTRVVGTRGYMAPEYVYQQRVSPKIDIFSFGVLVLEIVTRRSNCNSDDHNLLNLLSVVWDHWTKGTISQMLDRSLDGYSQNQALRCIHIGLLCVHPDPDDRPDISAVVFMLTRDSMELQSPAQPAFFFGGESPSASRSNGQSSYVYDRSGFMLEQSISVNGITLTELYPR